MGKYYFVSYFYEVPNVNFAGYCEIIIDIHPIDWLRDLPEKNHSPYPGQVGHNQYAHIIFYCETTKEQFEKGI